MGAAGRLASRAPALAVLAACALVLICGPAMAQSSGVSVEATFDGRDLESVDANEPLRLAPDGDPIVTVSVENDGDADVEVKTIRLHGVVLGLTFYLFDTRVDMLVEPGETDERVFELDLIDLRGQATGLVPSSLTLFDDDRDVVYSTDFPADVRGSLMSVYGVFGLAVTAITVLLLLAACIRLVTHRLPSNRWKRATRFGVPGAGVGLVLTFALSAFRVLSPDRAKWLTFIVVGGVIGFVAGYLTPPPPADDDDDDEDELDDEALQALGFVTPPPPPPGTPLGAQAPAAVFAPLGTQPVDQEPGDDDEDDDDVELGTPPAGEPAVGGALDSPGDSRTTTNLGKPPPPPPDDDR